ncbi:hypothetical protein [Moraxella bovoculi]|uniref:hypothetical protein n=1 Tax=Moraxella bovoculi TaxID=386891 RepID=UPI0013C37B3C|nr:hypothetical protein [Moraxella bovoculi]
MKKPNFVIVNISFITWFTCGIYGWQAANGWIGYLLMGNAIALFAIHLIMAIYYIGGRS